MIYFFNIIFHLDRRGSPQACLFVAHLAHETSEDALDTHFAPYGEILSIKILKDRASRPYAFVQFLVRIIFIIEMIKFL